MWTLRLLSLRVQWFHIQYSYEYTKKIYYLFMSHQTTGFAVRFVSLTHICNHTYSHILVSTHTHMHKKIHVCRSNGRARAKRTSERTLARYQIKSVKLAKIGFSLVRTLTVNGLFCTCFIISVGPKRDRFRFEYHKYQKH